MEQDVTASEVWEIVKKICQNQAVRGRIMNSLTRYVACLHFTGTYHKLSFTEKRCTGDYSTFYLLALSRTLIFQWLAVNAFTWMYLPTTSFRTVSYSCDSQNPGAPSRWHIFQRKFIVEDPSSLYFKSIYWYHRRESLFYSDLFFSLEIAYCPLWKAFPRKLLVAWTFHTHVQSHYMLTKVLISPHVCTVQSCKKWQKCCQNMRTQLQIRVQCATLQMGHTKPHAIDQNKYGALAQWYQAVFIQRMNACVFKAVHRTRFAGICNRDLVYCKFQVNVRTKKKRNLKKSILDVNDSIITFCNFLLTAKCLFMRLRMFQPIMQQLRTYKIWPYKTHFTAFLK